MADSLIFDPAKEFEVIETIEDFEEEIQRPEELRFFTLDEQLLDYQSKVLYGKTKVTRFEEKKIRNEMNRFREVHKNLITFSNKEDSYVIDTERKTVRVPWVKNIYADFKYLEYSYDNQWMPLMDPAQNKTPNYYDRMIKALPIPYQTNEQKGVPISERTTLVNEEGLNDVQGIGHYNKTKSVYHEDGTFSLQDVPISNTNDDLRVKGYYIDVRPVDIPNPLPEHPFLSSNKPSVLITDEPLIDVFPTIKTILNNGVPTTTDPYGEGMKFLKVYDVKLSQIPWSVWKEKFPVVDLVNKSPEVMTIQFSESKDDFNLSESVQKEYLSKCPSAFNPRLWLMRQEDAGALVSKLFLRNVGNAGNLAPAVPGEPLKVMFTESTPEECLVSNSFDAFLNSSVYRSPDWKDMNSAIDKDKPIPIGKCVPPDWIIQERKTVLTKDRIAWSESMPTNVIKEYRTLLRKFITLPTDEKPEKYEKFKSDEESELHKDIVVLLKDPNRSPEDKADAIQAIVNTMTPKDGAYFDKNDRFVVCNHTLALLRGDLEKDRMEFYNTWTVIFEGYRICHVCGEQVNNDVYIAQDEFNSEGQVDINYDVLTVKKEVVETITVNELERLFDKKSAGELMLLLLLSLIQIKPQEAIILPIIHYIRAASSVLTANKKISKDDREKIEGVFGIVGGVILLQTHIPFLLPKRSFGIKLFKTSGFPRDTDDESSSPVLDNILYVFKTYFANFPKTLDGPIVAVIRALTKNRKDVRDLSTKFLKQAKMTTFLTQFEIAKERYTDPFETIISNNLYLPVIHLDKTEYNVADKFGNEELMIKCDIPHPYIILFSKLPPNISQAPLEFAKDLRQSMYAITILPQKVSFPKLTFEDKVIRRRLEIKLPTGLFKNDKIKNFLNRDNIDAVSILTMMNRILDILSLNKFNLTVVTEFRKAIILLETSINKSLLRDVAKGLLYELLDLVSKDKNHAALGKYIDESMNRDLVMNMLLYTREDAETISLAASTQEREYFKQYMRSLNDIQREAHKRLIDIGMSPQVVKNATRIAIAEEFNMPDPELEYNALVSEADLQQPEDGYNSTRDYDGDDIPLNDLGEETIVDDGAYGDRMVYPYDDYSNTVGDFDDDYGS